jgi:hypothetical protein
MTGVSSRQPEPLDADTRAAAKRWLDTWKRVGPILDAERWESLYTMTAADAQQASQNVLELWQPDWRGDDGEGLMLLQRVFSRARR